MATTTPSRVRVLHVIVALQSLATALLCVNLFHPLLPQQSFTVVEAERINIRDRNGTLRAALSNTAGFKEAGRAKQDVRFAGLMFSRSAASAKPITDTRTQILIRSQVRNCRGQERSWSWSASSCTRGRAAWSRSRHLAPKVRCRALVVMTGDPGSPRSKMPAWPCKVIPRASGLFGSTNDV